MSIFRHKVRSKPEAPAVQPEAPAVARILPGHVDRFTTGKAVTDAAAWELFFDALNQCASFKVLGLVLTPGMFRDGALQINDLPNTMRGGCLFSKNVLLAQADSGGRLVVAARVLADTEILKLEAGELKDLLSDNQRALDFVLGARDDDAPITTRAAENERLSASSSSTDELAANEDSGQNDKQGDRALAEAEAAVDYFEVPVDVPAGSDGVCSDNDCPCGFPETIIPRGTGYLYISQTVVDFRRDARTFKEYERKANLMASRSGRFQIFGQDVATPTLMCELGARKRGLDLEVAAADARYWWKTGLVPLRATPLATAERR